MFKKLADFIVENRMCSNVGRQNRPTKSADFCMTDDRFLLADFIGRQNQPTLSIIWHPCLHRSV